MPKATATSETTKFDLESLEGAFVELRRLTYGEMLKRRDIGARMSGDGAQRDSKVYVELNQQTVTHYEFARAIMDHNLEDENGAKLNFQNPEDVERLDPRVAAEIENLIADMNQPPSADARKRVGVSSP